MKIGLVFTGSFRSGGVERIVYEMARNLGARHEVTVLADHWEEFDGPAVTYERVGPMRWPRGLVPLEFARRSTRAAGRHDFDRLISFGVDCPPGDIIWTQSVHAAWLERKGRAVAAARRLRPIDASLVALERSHYGRRRYTRMIAASEAVARDLGRLYRVPRADIDVVPNGFDPLEFSPQRRAALRDEERARLGLGDDDVVILMVANELARKGFPVLLDAVGRLGDARVKIVLAGRADPGTERVLWLGPQDDIGRIHAAADLFVLPTRYEAACIAIVEALASGLPVITTDVEGARDHVAADAGALQRDPLDAAELAALLSGALDVGVRRAWSAAAPGSVAELSWHRISETVEAVLDRAPARPARA